MKLDFSAPLPATDLVFPRPIFGPARVHLLEFIIFLEFQNNLTTF